MNDLDGTETAQFVVAGDEQVGGSAVGQTGARLERPRRRIARGAQAAEHALLLLDAQLRARVVRAHLSDNNKQAPHDQKQHSTLDHTSDSTIDNSHNRVNKAKGPSRERNPLRSSSHSSTNK